MADGATRELPTLWFNGRLVPWREAVVHVSSETALRATNVFEGIRAYRVREGFMVIALQQHLDRLAHSARLLEIPDGGWINVIEGAIGDLLCALNSDADLYLRPTLYLDEGGYTARPEEMRTGAFVLARLAESVGSQAISCIISSRLRAGEQVLPTAAKVGAVYTAFRLARREASRAGADEAILLNATGHVTETPGASVFIVKNGSVLTPALSDGILGSITRLIVIDILAKELAIRVSERSVTKADLLEADEVFLAGTLDEVRAVGRIDRTDMPSVGSITSHIRQSYLRICRGASDSQWTTLVRTPKSTRRET